MPSTNSDSNKKDLRTKPKQLSRNRLLRRKGGYEIFTSDHMAYLWAGYREGSLAWEQGLKPQQFRQLVEDLTAAVIQGGGDVYTMMGQTPRGRIPVGIMTTDKVEGPEIKPIYHPHAFWFSWASPRNKLECAAKFLIDLKKNGNIEIRSDARYWPFFQQLCNYGILRPVGKFRAYLADGRDVMVYQSVNSSMKQGNGNLPLGRG